ncbi:putative RNA methyltransferase [Sporosarcina pasteurii]|nr:methyltransferase domain-containing protein [Sporosarcina pasteurii]MDS9472085.1 methyltransferase domain-containing protein [Sporosarcina pasteurii]
MAISKKMMNAQALAKNEHLFRCPICSLTMEFKEDARLVCEKNHSFDLSRQGYVNLAPQAHVTKYDKRLFEARKTIITNGFFDPLLERLTALVDERVQNKQAPTIIDAGSGEGSHLASIVSKLSDATTGVGIDLAKEGVLAAAKDYPGHIWLVADLANCPFQDDTFDVMLNILSPANYAEFTRVLKPAGMFVKVVPENDYLKQLRTIFYDDAERQNEGNPVERTGEYFNTVKTERITYDFPLNQMLLEKLIQMTPLSWGASEDKIKSALQSEIPAVTVDYTIIIGTNE